jgi:hypothetical protein
LKSIGKSLVTQVLAYFSFDPDWEVFNTVSSQALTLRGYAEAMYRWFGREPRLSFAPFDQWKL